MTERVAKGKDKSPNRHSPHRARRPTRVAAEALEQRQGFPAGGAAPAQVHDRRHGVSPQLLLVAPAEVQQALPEAVHEPPGGLQPRPAHGTAGAARQEGQAAQGELQQAQVGRRDPFHGAQVGLGGGGCRIAKGEWASRRVVGGSWPVDWIEGLD